jgi:hypothetical protein
MIIDKFDLNPILVNINKLKPYRFVKENTFQPILVKPSDMLPKEPIEIDELCNPFTRGIGSNPYQ